MSSSCCNTKQDDIRVINRRTFLKTSAGAAAFAAFGDLAFNPKMVFAKGPLKNLIPFNKNLSTEWINSLTTRTQPEIYQGWDQQLKYVGMPVGGMGCGQLYIGGDGQLWHWDIFKSNYDRDPNHSERLDSMSAGGHYAKPIAQGEAYSHRNGAEVEQGFAIKIQHNGKTFTRRLNRHDFSEVTFRVEYPISKVNYVDGSLPIDINLEAFSPFVPLNEDDSALPVTVLSFKLTNTSNQKAHIDLIGWLENAVCPYNRDISVGVRKNWVSQIQNGVSIVSELVSDQEQEDLKKIHGHGSMSLSVINVSNDASIRTLPSFKLSENKVDWFNQFKSDNEESQQLSMDEMLL